ncbi:hypothetical protein [Leucobacter luti]|uniref:DUF7882 domain-containing protein n=1 Tax=Leucobacter luti TaxID=340320 RepID=A0A4V3CXS9_9MICO|nr:hypothetical protein [Leucobacter luti]MCW2288169.1 hypothetical protein [Leucobacter luti]QYM75858.1 hypothetical protein K1X41_14875 [Leucobacter luti]TCK45670.1 hypothetical protein EDF60_0902 [Leucobacter luti]TDP91428.1 hypothetical protein EDF62_2043 [Leucobacter luti]
MGFLVHGEHEYEFDDRVLAHLKVVIGQKLMRHEGFFLSWSKTPDEGSGRISLWLSPASTLAFRFGGSKPPEINMLWLKVLSARSHASRGLVVITEDEAESFARNNPDLL